MLPPRPLALEMAEVLRDNYGFIHWNSVISLGFIVIHQWFIMTYHAQWFLNDSSMIIIVILLFLLPHPLPHPQPIATSGVCDCGCARYDPDCAGVAGNPQATARPIEFCVSVDREVVPRHMLPSWKPMGQKYATIVLMRWAIVPTIRVFVKKHHTGTFNDRTPPKSDE